MKMDHTSTLACSVFSVLMSLIGVGCRSTLPLAVSDPSSWSADRAIGVINRASNPNRMTYDHLFKGQSQKTDDWAEPLIESNAYHNGFVLLTWTNHFDQITKTNTTIYLVRHVPYGMVTEVRLEKMDGYGLGLVLCGLINPLLREYVVHVRFWDRELCYHEPGKKWGFFPLWLIRPFYFVNEDRKTFAEDLAQAFEYMRINCPGVQPGVRKSEK